MGKIVLVRIKKMIPQNVALWTQNWKYLGSSKYREEFCSNFPYLPKGQNSQRGMQLLQIFLLKFHYPRKIKLVSQGKTETQTSYLEPKGILCQPSSVLWAHSFSLKPIYCSSKTVYSLSLHFLLPHEEVI